VPEGKKNLDLGFRAATGMNSGRSSSRDHAGRTNRCRSEVEAHQAATMLLCVNPLVNSKLSHF
jgi:hypothetical protein